MVGTKQKTELQYAVSAVFGQGTGLIASISDRVFSGDDPLRSIGAHFRHNFEFAVEFLRGIETGTIDYAARRRDQRFASERGHALACMSDLVTRLESAAIEPDQPIFVVSETGSGATLGSTVGRELEFLLSHTIHHYALIAFKLELLGIAVPEGFGVAPSTLRFWNVKSEGENS